MFQVLPSPFLIKPARCPTFFTRETVFLILRYVLHGHGPFGVLRRAACALKQRAQMKFMSLYTQWNEKKSCDIGLRSVDLKHGFPNKFQYSFFMIQPHSSLTPLHDDSSSFFHDSSSFIFHDSSSFILHDDSSFMIPPPSFFMMTPLRDSSSFFILLD
ncbi:hypothetical protein CEXT_379831 [Caerostris extrusa]|uniref:Uncharacterized protein n=1 Tax=Caerostris extrusa TaxID=172846 RepID=A0AAV4MMD0_CAEEX|nr:hypothetical protein CEXT_379831 [Caerostris extrusa]